MTAPSWVVHALPWLLAVGVLLASLRLLLQSKAADIRPRVWRTGVSLLGQAVSAVLLFLLLRTSQPEQAIHTLHLLTAHAPAAAAPVVANGERWLRLPEATERADIAPVPDLATALRQHPQVRALHVIGDGLEARDRDAVSGVRLSFEPAPLAIGISDWWAPQALREGETLHVVGNAHAAAGMRVALLDPAGQVIDEQVLQRDGGFALQAATRSAGLAEYRLQLRDRDGRQRDTSAVHVRIAPSAPTRLLLLAGGPDPDLKYLRRWAADHGAQLRASIELGGGMRAGDPPFALDARTLGATDLLILDDRSWNALDRRRRDAVLAAVDAGMGLLLRASLPLANADALGLRVRSASLAPTYRIPGAIEGTDAPPMMRRPQLRIDIPGGRTLLRDDRSLALAGWRAHGRGRIGAWLPGDTFRLALAGHGDLHARQWASVVNAVMRPRARAPAPLPLRSYVGERVLVCSLGDAARVQAPAATLPVRLTIDPRSGHQRCAAYWPAQPGWHSLLEANSEQAFLVRAGTEDGVLRAAHTQRATKALAAQQQAPAPKASPTTAVPRWLLFLGWLAVMAALWWLERSQLGRAVRATTG